MKFICQKKDLVNAVTSAQRAVAVHSSNPSLEGLFLKTNGDVIEIYGYDMEIGIKVCIEADIEKEGSVILPSKVFFEIVRNLPDVEVRVEVDHTFTAMIKSGLSEFSILGLNPEEYPSLPFLREEDTIKIPKDIIKSMIRQTIYAVSTDNSKPAYTGSRFEIEDGKIRIISIDGCRLAIREEQLNCDTIKNKAFIVPAKALNEVMRLIDDDSDDDVKICVDRRYATFELDNYFIISRLLEGKFMDFHNAIPDVFNINITVSVNNFCRSIERVSLLIKDKGKYPIKCLFDETYIRISCMTGVGKATDIVDAKVKGKTLEMGFNERYLTDALKNSDTDEVLISIKDDFNPIKITALNSEHFMFLILPVRIRE